MSSKAPSGLDVTVPDSPAAAETLANPAPVKVREPAEFARGAQLGRYVVLERLGGGGMGVVYAAYDPELDRRVAVKLLRPDGNAGTEGRTRLIREAQAMARLTHPNVIGVHDVGTLQGSGEVFVAMEFVDGKTLHACMGGRVRPYAEVLPLFVQAGRGLEAAHAAGLVHRDFKPENVLVGHDGRVRVLDFGLARAQGAAQETRPSLVELDSALTEVGSGGALATPLTRTGAFMGTPAYMAPEQLLSQPADARTDQFSFCVALYEAVYGQRPFNGATVAELFTEVVQGNVRPPPHGCNTPLWLSRAILRGLKTKPEERWPSMRELLDSLENDAGAAKRRRRGMGAVAALVGLAAVGAVAVKRPPSAPACGGAAQKLSGVWDAARKQAVHAAFAQTKLPFAEEAFASTARMLDGFGAAWVAMHTDACEATAVRHEQSPQLLDARVQCLTGRLDELRATTELLAHADASVVQHAADMAQSLDPVDGCGKPSSLRTPLDPPADPVTRGKVAELRRSLAGARALADASRLEEARAQVTPLVDEARAVGYAPLLAEALYRHAAVLSQLGQREASASLVNEAIDVAEASRHDEIVARSWTLVTHDLRLGERYAEARAAAGHASGFLKRIGGDPDIEVALEMELSRMGGSFEHPDEGLEHAARAVELAVKAHGPRDPGTFAPRATRLSALVHAARFEEAVKEGEPLLADAQAALGAVDLDVAIIEINLGEALSELDRLDDAEPHLRHGIELFERIAPGHELVGVHLWKLAALERRKGRLREAEATLDRSVAILDRVGGALAAEQARAARAWVWLLEGRAGDAVPVLETALVAARRELNDPNDVGRIELPLGMALWASHVDPTRARALVGLAHAHLRFPVESAEAKAWLDEHPQ